MNCTPWPGYYRRNPHRSIRNRIHRGQELWFERAERHCRLERRRRGRGEADRRALWLADDVWRPVHEKHRRGLVFLTLLVVDRSGAGVPETKCGGKPMEIRALGYLGVGTGRLDD